jgi:hypothetical protein
VNKNNLQHILTGRVKNKYIPCRRIISISFSGRGAIPHRR